MIDQQALKTARERIDNELGKDDPEGLSEAEIAQRVIAFHKTTAHIDEETLRTFLIEEGKSIFDDFIEDSTQNGEVSRRDVASVIALGLLNGFHHGVLAERARAERDGG